MGGNGTASVNGSIPLEEREYVSLGKITDPLYGDIEIVEWRAGKNNRSPEESNSAPRIYVTFYKNGSGMNEIAKYGSDHKKEWAIHTEDHASKKAKKNGTAIYGPHYHEWKNGKPSPPNKLLQSDPRMGLLERVQNFQKLKK